MVLIYIIITKYLLQVWFLFVYCTFLAISLDNQEVFGYYVIMIN